MKTRGSAWWRLDCACICQCGLRIQKTADNAGITPADATGEVTLYQVNGSDPAERWAILLPQNATETTVSYKDQDNANVAQTIDLPAIRANSFYGGYSGISVGLEYVDLGLSSGRKWAALFLHIRFALWVTICVFIGAKTHFFQIKAVFGKFLL